MLRRLFNAVRDATTAATWAPDAAAFLATIERMAAENARLAAALAVAEERLRQLASGPAREDAAVTHTGGSGRAKTVVVGEDATRPGTSFLGRLLAWLRGA